MIWNRNQKTCLTAVVAMFLAAPTATNVVQADTTSSDDADLAIRTMAEADWDAQEQRRNREPHDPAAVGDALNRARQLLECRLRTSNAGELANQMEMLRQLRQEVEASGSLDNEGRLALYRKIRWFTRDLALGNPLLDSKPLVFLKRRRFVCQMLHEYLGYYYDYADIAGGGVFVLQRPGRSFAVRELARGRLPRGNFTTLALSYDASTIYFAFAERAAEKPDYYSPERRSFHIFAVDVNGDGKDLRQLTNGLDDDFDPCPLPDGRIAFMSTRRGGFGRCHNPWEPLPTYTLHKMDASGDNVTTLSHHETNQWHPSVLNDGRIVYSRWDYVDRSASNFHGLWTSNPDGTNPIILFGNYTKRINACYQPRAIPGSDRIAFIAGAHHAAVGGSLVVLDPTRIGLDRQTGEDSFDAIEVLTPEVCFPEAPDWPDSYFHSPWPLSEDVFLVAFSFDPLPGMGPGVRRDTETGLYYFDRFGNLELLYHEPGISCMYPIPLTPRPAPPIRPDAAGFARKGTGEGSAERDDEACARREGEAPAEPGRRGQTSAQQELRPPKSAATEISGFDQELVPGDEGEFVLVDVGRSLMSLPDSRPIRSLRIFQVLPKAETHVADRPKIGYARAESARMLLGAVPVEADGSAYFRAPARRPLYFQAVDGTGRAVQTMRSVTYLQPGQRRGCVGCHEPVGTSPDRREVMALRRPPSAITSGPDGSHPFCYPRLVQPVLDRHCVACHDGSEGADKSGLVLTGEPVGTFTRSFESLRPFVRWYEWGGNTIGNVITRPGQIGADASPLLRVLDDSTHLASVKLSGKDRDRIHVWLDGNAPFYGTYSEAEQRLQHQGKAVPPPRVQ